MNISERQRLRTVPRLLAIIDYDAFCLRICYNQFILYVFIVGYMYIY